MSYLRIDTDGARELVTILRAIDHRVEPIQRLLVDAEQLADLATANCLVLDEVAEDARRTAAQIETALRIVEQFQLRLATTMGSRSEFVPTNIYTESTPPLWDATSDRSWNLVHQVASHNSYVETGGIAALYEQGVRSFELDIHRGAPTDFAPQPLPWSLAQVIVTIVADQLDHGGGRPDDWRVYHTSVGPESEYRYLSDGIAAVVSLDTTDPLTLFVDNKDAFAGTHTSVRFDELLDEEIGDRLYTPTELIARAPGATSLREAVTIAGWPTIAELEGRILVVLTDEIDGYQTASARAFVGAPPEFARNAGVVVHLADDNIVFHNADARWLTSDDHLALQRTNSVLRTYFGPTCVGGDVGIAGATNYRAVDISDHLSQCAAVGAVATDD